MNKRRLYAMAARIPAGIETKEFDLATEVKTIRDEIVGKVGDQLTKMEAMQRQLDSLDLKTQNFQLGLGSGGVFTKSIAEEIFENESFKEMAENGGRGRAVIKINDFHKKSLTDAAAGLSTSGVLATDRLPGIVPVQFRQLRIRDLLRSAATTAASVDYVKVSSFTNAASPQVETATKAQSDMSLQAVQMPVRTIAHWIRASKQIMDDLPGLQEAVNTHLLYGLNLKIEAELLSGDGTGEHLSGLIPAATAFSTSLLGSGSWNRLDIIARAIQQAERSDYGVDSIVLHTDDFWSMALTKSTQGEYLFGEPGATTVPTLWGRPVAVTNSIASGTFLVGSSQTALIRDRMEATIDISGNYNDDFVKNMLVILCEARLALQITKPGAWITGSFSTSPA
jgi:HK97 family phage major capsid protein